MMNKKVRAAVDELIIEMCSMARLQNIGGDERLSTTVEALARLIESSYQEEYRVTDAIGFAVPVGGEDE